ncbi:hypothetical protein GWI33_023204 [Rhynchophorus ferrugineus]|uniref:Uncharacterized protein n=1 Tax=Rhynchophorus ferrugineus TaxID=354439 RepID=A0A834M446_RHYFE|nr:hypothetical protein GWI33_023204 [Rhynchophorus ferrugineus]
MSPFSPSPRDINKETVKKFQHERPTCRPLSPAPSSSPERLFYFTNKVECILAFATKGYRGKYSSGGGRVPGGVASVPSLVFK